MVGEYDRPCPHCDRNDFNNRQGFWYHVNHCEKNPKNQPGEDSREGETGKDEIVINVTGEDDAIPGRVPGEEVTRTITVTDDGAGEAMTDDEEAEPVPILLVIAAVAILLIIGGVIVFWERIKGLIPSKKEKESGSSVRKPTA